MKQPTVCNNYAIEINYKNDYVPRPPEKPLALKFAAQIE